MDEQALTQEIDYATYTSYTHYTAVLCIYHEWQNNLVPVSNVINLRNNELEKFFLLTIRPHSNTPCMAYSFHS